MSFAIFVYFLLGSLRACIIHPATNPFPTTQSYFCTIFFQSNNIQVLIPFAHIQTDNQAADRHNSKHIPNIYAFSITSKLFKNEIWSVENNL